MSDYIKKEDAEQELQHFCDDMLHHFEMNFFAERARVKDCMDIIRKVPSADVVEVVRCKDCKHLYKEGRSKRMRDLGYMLIGVVVGALGALLIHLI